MKKIDGLYRYSLEVINSTKFKRGLKKSTVFTVIFSIFFSFFINFFPFNTKAASYTGKQLRTIEYVLGGATDTTSRTTGTLMYAGASWDTVKATAGTKAVTIPGTGIAVKNAYLETGFNMATSGSVTNVALTLDAANGPAPGTMVNSDQARGTTITTSGLSSYEKVRGDVTALFDRQTDGQFNAGIGVVAGVAVTGPTRSLTTIKLVVTYEQDYNTTVHNEVKTVRFALDSTNGTDTGTRTAVCAAAATCSFAFNANIPDATADGNIQDVYFELHAEAPASAATAPSFTPQITGGAAGTSHNAVDVLTDDMNMNVIYRPAVGSPNFQRSTAQQLDIVNGAAVALNGLGGELVVTYTFSTGAATQTDTVRYYMNQLTTSPGVTRQAFSQTINVSNTGYTPVDIWYKVRVPSTETLNLTVDGTVGASTLKSNVYALGGTNTIRAGDVNTLYYDMKADSAFLTTGATLAGGITFSSATGDAPTATEAFVTFTWSGSSGGTVTKSVLYSAQQQYGGAASGLYWNTSVAVDLPETVTKTYRSAYINADINHSQGTSITAGNIITGVDGTITTVAENGEEGTATTAEAYNTTNLHNISNTIFSGGATIGWQERSFTVHNSNNVNNAYYYGNVMAITYDAALGAVTLNQNHYRWRDDTTALNNDGGWAAAQDAIPTLTKSTVYRLRTEVANTGTAPAVRYPYRLEFAARTGGTCGDETFAAVPVTASTEHFEMVGSGQYVDGETLTASRLTATGTFTNGRGVEDPSNNSNAITINGGNYTEIEYAVQATTNATDGGNYCFQVTNIGSKTNITTSVYAEALIASGGNTAPNVPSALAQKKVTGGATLNTGDWTNETQVQFTATASDTDASDTLYLCVEKDNINTALSAANGGDLCGTGVAYSGTPVAVTVTITGMTDATEYHWRAQVRDTASAYSTYVAYGSNPVGDGTTDGSPANRDFGIDTTAPTGGTVNDGTGADSDYNSGSLDTLSANWSGFVTTVAGLNRYEYAIGTTQGGTQVVNWTTNGTGVSVTVGSLSLRTSQKYYFSVRAADNAGSTGTAVNSNGQEVLPSISFTLNESAVLFNNLNTTNSWTDTKTSTFTTTTNAYNGYSVIAYATDYLRSLSYPSAFIPDFQGTYAVPDTWSPPGDSKYGFGYGTSDCNVNSGLFWTGASCTGSQKFARFSQSAPGDKVADHAGGIVGSPITNETFTVTYRLAVQGSQTASKYQTNITYIVAPNF